VGQNAKGSQRAHVVRSCPEIRAHGRHAESAATGPITDVSVGFADHQSSDTLPVPLRTNVCAARRTTSDNERGLLRHGTFISSSGTMA
jgi:hypothetical protein